MCELLDFFWVHRYRCGKSVEDVEIESMKALYCLHQIRCQAVELNMLRWSQEAAGVCQVEMQQQVPTMQMTMTVCQVEMQQQVPTMRMT